MSKQSISVKISSDNLLWLRGRARAAGTRSISEAIDRLISDARTGRSDGPHRTVVGTIKISDSDPDLSEADADLRALFRASLDEFPPRKKRRRKQNLSKRVASKGQSRG